ncbi:MAG: rhodanese-like domain-containing protein [Patescibacteria group bacterium]|nr:rhodanese-like domain-containing protein [Patescibacteria group bacterium]
MLRIRFISLDQLLEMMVNRDPFKLVEVLSEENYQEGHIPGAINLPLGDLEKVASKHLKKEETIVVYCASYACHASTKATEILQKMGYKMVYDFKGSKKLWVDSGLELAKSAND